MLAIAAAGLLGWGLTFSQQQAFSLTPPAPGQIEGERTAAENGTVVPVED